MITRIAVLLCALAAGSAQAALHDRGGGLIYDDVLNVTWLQDTAYSRTSGYNNDSPMDWYQANAWANGLVYGGFDDWRLPRTLPLNGTSYQNIPRQFTDFAGTTDSGYNNTSISSELGYMFFVNLKNKAAYDVSGAPTGCYPSSLTNKCFQNLSFIDVESGNTISFLNARQNYWSESEFNENGYDLGFYFATYNGFQAIAGKGSIAIDAWAVRDGDVAAIPEPETYAMFLAGLGLIAVAAGRKAA